MSIINKMLQDLEKRRARFASPENAPMNRLVNAHGSAERHGSRHLIRALVMASVIVSLLVGALFYSNQQKDQALSQVKPVTEKKQLSLSELTSTEAVASSVPAPMREIPDVTAELVSADSEQQPQRAQAQLRSFWVESREHGSQLFIDMTGRPKDHRVHLDGNLLKVNFQNMDSVYELEDSDLEGSVFTHVTTLTQADGLLLQFELKHKVKLASSTLLDQPDNSVQLRIEVVAEPVRELSSARPEPPEKKTVAHRESNSAPSIKQLRPLDAVQSADLAYQKAMSLLRNGNHADTITQLQLALKFHQQHIPARKTLAMLFLDKGRVSEAEGLLQQGLQLNSHATELSKLYARILVNQENILKAVTLLEQSQPANQDDPSYYALLAACYQRLARHQDAELSYQKALALQPEQGVWWMGMAISLEAQGKVAPAINAFRRASVSKGLSAALSDFIKQRIQALALLTGKTG